MYPLTLEQLAGLLDVSAPVGAAEVTLTGVSTDSRTCREGDLFVALPGQRVQGAAFCPQAAQRGATAALVAETDTLPEGSPRKVLRVADPLAAIARIASWNRGQIRVPVIAVTGTNGKTTTKDMIAHILGRRQPGVWARRSFNNALGLPMTLLEAGPEHAYVVLEVGTNRPGDVDSLASLARPDVAVVTNVSEGHLAGLGTIEGVAAEKARLLAHLSPGGTAVLNADNRWTRAMESPAGTRRVTFGGSVPADVVGAGLHTSMSGITFQVNGAVDVRIPILGACNQYNALAALAVARALGRSLAEGAAALSDFQAPPMRMQLRELGGITFINDAYNSNPRSALYALDEFEQLRLAHGHKVVVFGDMRELGAEARRFHEQIGARLAQMDLYAVLLVGPESRVIADAIRAARGGSVLVYTFAAAAEAADPLRALLAEGDLALLKGSRGIGLERLLESFETPVVAS